MKPLNILAVMFILTCTSCDRETRLSAGLVDPQATAETKLLYKRLFELRKQGIMLGHQDALIYGHGWYGEANRSDVKDVIDDYPAVIGWELGHIELGAEYNLDSVYFADMKRLTRTTHERGGITTFSWHGDNIVTGGTSWDCKGNDVVRSVLEGGDNHDTYRVWLNRLGDFFLDLKDSKGKLIPVIFRMYHEHTGSWFWWGAQQCTPDEYKQLWIMTISYLRDVKGVHNLIYSYCPAAVKSHDEYFARYPGDGWVDIFAFDIYLYGLEDSPETAVENYKNDMKLNLDIVTEYAAKTNKLAIIGETGLESIDYNGYFTDVVYESIKDYPICWVLFWRNAWEIDKPQHYYVPYKGHASETDFRNFITSPKILSNRAIK